MQSTLNPKQPDDPHDVLAVAPTDEELSKLVRTFRHPSNPQIRTGSDLPAGPSVPPVDTTFRPAFSDVQVPGRRRSIGGRAARAVTAPLLLAVCAGVAAIAWQSYGDAAERMIAQWVPQRILTSFLPPDKRALPAQPAPVAQTAPEGVAPTAAAPSVDSAKSLRSMAHDIASVGQEIEELKASQQH
jgi:hypothetical protein